MEIYLVGGAVRDQLLNLPVKDKDWVVIGATPEELLQQGYIQVGKDFPVFLDPKKKEEYALARTEKKTGVGYTGFICDFSPEITLEQDLIRRDLTINAIAQDSQGNLHDPYGGVNDLNHRLLRHISPAFAEDPLRVLRVARFAARYHYLGFQIAPETIQLMKEITLSGELSHLTTERVWLETEKALQTQNPEIYFEILRKINALAVLFPELNALYGVPNPVQHHPEVDSFIHTMMVLHQASLLTTKSNKQQKSAVRFAAICHDLGKALTPKDMLPRHIGHEHNGIIPTRNLCNRLKVPSYIKELACLVCETHTNIHRAFDLRPATIVRLFNKLDVWRKAERFEQLLLVCKADAKGRKGFEQVDYPQADFLLKLYQAALQVDVQQVIRDGFEKEKIREELNKRRQKAIEQAKKGYHSSL
ncbi:multifunctional CCA addition/repair protein [Avibacterium sp. 21-595]|uniref:multifunctional CCA addition/repair protein n=1 Tax=Avibacterium sp. 21-595 TaxID=2911527 RepID=UPI00202672EE|nr:multifunctional CCA addition/repair protein [Avibacterium sp. 21-595]URL07411.1 multifunctional CCA addition/repair protein [Avibacterium sp. 21-595]